MNFDKKNVKRISPITVAIEAIENLVPPISKICAVKISYRFFSKTSIFLSNSPQIYSALLSNIAIAIIFERKRRSVKEEEPLNVTSSKGN